MGAFVVVNINVNINVLKHSAQERAALEVSAAGPLRRPCTHFAAVLALDAPPSSLPPSSRGHAGRSPRWRLVNIFALSRQKKKEKTRLVRRRRGLGEVFWQKVPEVLNVLFVLADAVLGHHVRRALGSFWYKLTKFLCCKVHASGC